jgi:hypothetical protein
MNAVTKRRIGFCMACTLLAGCAGTSTNLAPVESRVIDDGSSSPATTYPGTPAQAPRTDGGASVTSLPAPEPVSGVPRPLSADGSGAATVPPPPPLPAEGAKPQPVPQLALATPVTTTRAVDDILRDVRRRWVAGQHEQAAAGLERALRIEPANPYLWQHLAAVRLDQGRPKLAEQFAAKANSVAGDSAPVRLRNWRIIAEARRQQGNLSGARTAETRAAEYEQADR